MSDTELLFQMNQKLTEVATNVTFLRGSFEEYKKDNTEKLDNHIDKDEHNLITYIKPLYDESLKRQGEEKGTNQTSVWYNTMLRAGTLGCWAVFVILIGHYWR